MNECLLEVLKNKLETVYINLDLLLKLLKISSAFIMAGQRVLEEN